MGYLIAFIIGGFGFIFIVLIFFCIIGLMFELVFIGIPSLGMFLFEKISDWVSDLISRIKTRGKT